jgi:hypothetical protein
MKTIILPLLLLVAQQGFSAPVGPNAAPGYVAHEWGTFTSVQGADGVLMPWNPLDSSKLPNFVYNWSRPGLNRRPAGALNPGSKSALVSLQRMETPVIYLYSDRERTVDVSVRFPQGLITEWFPQAQEIGPSSFAPGKLATTLDGWMQQVGLHPQTPFALMFRKKGVPDSRIQWRQVRVLPPGNHTGAPAALPTDTSGSHYFAARQTDAALVRAPSPGNGQPVEQEKFLFYRGVANFKTPLTVVMGGAQEDQFQLQNSGDAELRHLFLLSVRNGRGRLALVERLGPGQSAAAGFAGQPVPLDEVVVELSREMKGALVREGLYEREAAAMVETWRTSWFEEEGLRVLYTLPRAWTDETLPLTINPNPGEIVRVMVGRAEVIPPTITWELLRQIVRYSDGDPAGRQQAIAKINELGLGRFLQPAVQSVLGARPSQEFSQNAWELLGQATRLQRQKALAAK